MMKKTAASLCFAALTSAVCLHTAESSNITGPERIASYGLFDKPGIVLFTNSTDNRVRRAFLQIDCNGKPALYPCRHVGPELSKEKMAVAISGDLTKFCLSDVVDEWKIAPVTPGLLELKLSGWSPRTREWNDYKVELHFDNATCSSFRVTGPEIVDTDWLKTAEIPNNIKTGKDLPALPIAASCIEGPSNMSDCGRFNP